MMIHIFSFLTKENINHQVSCSMTYTNEQVHKIIQKIYLRALCILEVLKELVQGIVLLLEDKIVKVLS